MAEMVAYLRLVFVRIRAVIAALQPHLLRHEDTVADIGPIAELRPLAQAAILMADRCDVREQVIAKAAPHT